jgi:hypothetical protein
MAVDPMVLKTVKRMFASGLDEAAVESALADLGLSKTEQDEIMAAAGRKPKPAASAPKVEEVEGAGDFPSILEEEEKEIIADKTAKKVKKHLEEKEAMDSLRETTAQVAIEEQGRRIGEVKEKLARGVPLQAGLEKRIYLMEAELKTIKAQNNALQSLLKKILDANRSIQDFFQQRL